MGTKSKWSKQAKQSLANTYLKLEEAFNSLSVKNGQVDLKNRHSDDSTAYLMAVLLNSYLAASEDGRTRRFGADDIVPLKIEIDGSVIRYLGKIYWIFKPKEHQCHRSYLDPFYGEFEFQETGLRATQLLFGNYEKTDMDTDGWINSNIEWMYEL